MTRSLDQILSEEQLEITPLLVRTPTATILVGDDWSIFEYFNDHVQATRIGGPNPWTIFVLVASIGIAAWAYAVRNWWALSLAVAGLAASLFAIVKPFVIKQDFERTWKLGGVSLASGGGEGTNIFSSDDKDEINQVRKKVEDVLLTRNAQAK